MEIYYEYIFIFNVFEQAMECTILTKILDKL